MSWRPRRPSVCCWCDWLFAPLMANGKRPPTGRPFLLPGLLFRGVGLAVDLGLAHLLRGRLLGRHLVALARAVAALRCGSGGAGRLVLGESRGEGGRRDKGQCGGG